MAGNSARKRFPADIATLKSEASAILTPKRKPKLPKSRWPALKAENFLIPIKPRTDPHVVTVDDAESVAEKIAIAKKYKLRGVSLFKIDGLTDPKVFEILKR